MASRSVVGQILGHYRILEPLAAGGMGEVYRARDTKLERDVAIKILPAASVADPTAKSRLLREARTAAQLNHPNICTIHEVGEADGCVFIAMELVAGEPLSAKLRSGPLAAEVALRYGLQLAEALAHAHQHKIIHRDLKSGNVMVTPEGRVKILDFGLAKQTVEATPDEVTKSQLSLTQPGAIVGTLGYMAPERLRGKTADARSDIWALGVVLYEMLAGKLPFAGETEFEMSSAILHKAPATLPSSVPIQLRALVDKSLEKEPTRRYQTGDELRLGLEAIRGNTVQVFIGVRYWVSRHRRLASTIAVAVMIAIAVAANIDRFQTYLGRAPVTDSIAVLPFLNDTGSPEMEYLSDGITESLINTLSRVPGLTVMSRNSVFRYKGRTADAQAAGQTLNVRAVLIGSVAQRGDRLTISAELIEVQNGRHLWGEQYNRRFVDILALQDEISTGISEKLRPPLSPEQKQRLVKRYTENTEAYQLFLKGRYYFNKKTPSGFSKGIEYFEKAIEADPSYAPAYAGLAESYTNLGNYNFALISPKEAWFKAQAAANKAIQIDEGLASGHAALAITAYQWEWDWAAADKEFKRALELDPNLLTAHHWYAHYLMTIGRTEESLRAGQRALQVDPLDLANNAHQGWYFLFTRDYDRALEPLKRTLEMDPNFSVAQWYLGLAYEQQGRYDMAIAQFENCVRLTGGRPSMVALLGHAYALANRRSEAEATLRQLATMSKQQYVPPYAVGVIHAALGNNEEALTRLEQAYDEHDSWMDYLALDPRLDELRSHPRFVTLLQRMRLAPYARK